MLRRIALTIAALAIFASQTHAQTAQTYPTKPVRIVAPFGPGGGGDILTRIIAQNLTEKFGQTFIVENKAGGNGIIGANEALAAPPDGYTLFLATTTVLAVTPNLTKTIPYNPVRDFAAIAQLTTVPYVLVVNSEIPVNSAKELIEYAKKKPDPLFYASGSTPAIVAGALFSQMADVKMTHVPYKATVPALTDVLTGRVSLMFSDFAPALEQLKGGKIRALGVTTKNRSLLLPDVPSVAEALPGFEIIGWVSLCARAGVPREIVDKLSAAIKDILQNDDVKKKILALGMDPTYSTPEQHDALIKAELDNWARLVKLAGIEAQ